MKITEKNYIQQLQLHNEEALIYVIDMYGGLLKAVIRKHLFTMPQKQEECMNDVLLSIWEHAASFDDEKNSFKNWAAAIARYEAIDYLRKYKRDLEQLCMDDVTAAENIYEIICRGRICRADKRRYRTSERCHLQPGIQRKAENEKHVFETEGGMKR